ncbi:FERM and PDZ domain-containing protein 3 isoform X2 [Brienomyrus brachyistius]|nr:FERM and PDZ domain-containing protein 3 isoform X2 [Brienomyrus brachyistius]XP_048883428.1 FERM and PDZ domain-containing protein 3 isoform X2 [Brienomyrus brachyistius]XP_048883429.1 FERM and PDZ domain-containing protein 3 isoform X2 [Brienomyrus brachyistius]
MAQVQDGHTDTCGSPAMLEESYNGMDSGSLTPGSARQVCILRHPSHGFGFIAGSERPVIIRSVSADGPSEGKLLPGDQILTINNEPVSDVPRERVIDLVRSCKESIVLTVLQPQQSPKSAFISAAKKARLRTNPPKVRFSEQVSISDPDSTMLKDDSLLLIPNVLKVFLENGQIKSFTFDSRTTVRDVISSLQDRLSLRYIEHFALVLESGGLHQNQRLHLLQDTQPLSHVVQRTYFQGMKCLFRICYFPKDPADLLRRDPAAFEYLYIQSRNDVIKERFGIDWKSDITLKLAALHIYITVSAARPNQKISLKHVEKEWGLEPFLPLTLLPTVKEKNVCKSLSQLLKTYQHPPPAGNKVPPLQGKLQYMRALNDLPPFGGLLFHTVGLDEKQSATTLLVGPRHGISHVIDLKNNLTTVLAEFSRISKVQLFRENQGVARVEVTILEAKPLVLLMEWPDASNFACLISGYYKLFVDPKKTIYCRTPGQSHMIKADYRSPHTLPQLVPSMSSSSRREEREGIPRESSRRPASPPHSQHLGLCHLHLKEQKQLQELQMQAEEEVDFNENIIFQEESRPRTKSDPTLKSTESIAEPVAVEHSNSGTEFRGRANTLEASQRHGRFFCDSCKAKLKAAAEGVVAVNGGSQRCSNACASRDGGAVDLMSLPPPGNEEDEEMEEGGGKLQLPPPAIAAPPPGFRDNSSDEDDPNRGRKAQGQALAVEAQEEVPVTLIDNVATRTVRDHAQELDDALVSTLQALEALAASEDYPHHQPTPQTAGLIVLAAITPESSLDSGHETNSSELTDVSEMVSAMKQHQNQAYLLAHHINKDRLFGRRDFPLAIPGCSAQALGGGTFSVSQLRAGGPPKSVILSKATQLRVIPTQETTVPSITVDPVQTQPQTSVQDTGKSNLVPPQDVSADCSSQASRELTVVEQGEKKSISNDQGSLSPKKERLSPKPAVKGDVKGKAPKTPSPESTKKALPILLPVDGANSTNSHPGSQENQTVSSKTSKPSSSKDLLISDDDLFCTCPIKPKPSVPLRAKDPQAHKVVVFHSSSPTDDERLRAKAKTLQLASSKESTTQGPEHSQTKSTLLVPPKCSPLPPKKTGHKEIPDIKTENSQSKVSNETQKVTKTVPVLVETSKATSYADKAATIPAMDCKKQGNNKAKTQRSAPFLSFRNLLSATFPARLRRETDERQAQLQKVRQYELEFLEELLKPKAAQAEFLPQGPSLVPVGTSCACQLRSSPVQKVPGVSREQRRSCDCKRLCRGIRLPDTPVGSALERRGRERTVSKTPPTIHKTSPEGPKKASQLEGAKRPQTLEIKTTRIRSTSLESREPQGKPVSCLPTCTSHSECIAAPHYMKLQRRYSIGEADSNECAPLYAEVKKVKSKSLEKEMERVRATGLRLPTPVEPSYSHAGDGKRKGVFSIQEEELLKEDRVEANEVVLGLPSEDNDDRQKCCSFCFCYRKCDTTDENSEKDELSYSIPLQVLPGMQLDSHAMPVVSKTLQVLDAEDCSGEVEVEDPQNHEIDLRACSSLEASLSRVKALQGKTFSLPDGFLTAQLDANELLAILRQCASSPQAEDELRLQAPQLAEYKQELALRFKEFRASCRRVAGVEKSPTRMLSAVTASFQVLCSLTQSFIQLVRGVRSETQRLQLLRKVEEVAVNYTLLLRAAEESMGHSSSLPTKSSSPLPGNPAANMGSLNRPINSLSTK